MECTISLNDTIVEKLAYYQRVRQKRSIEEAITELLQYALTMSTRQKFLETLRNMPETNTTLSEEEQLAMVDQVRQEIYEEQSRQ